ncbi:MAG: FKBP-type peptidyl-prolyl cis-trans isomerase [Nanoarchaeota archaeon]
MKENDFIEISYTGMVDGLVFDTTDEKVAQANGMFDPQHQYGPVIICLGRGHVLPGLDAQLMGKELGKQHQIFLSADQAFGRKRADLIQLIPTGKFRKEQIIPEPGLRVQIDGRMGLVKTVTGGRTLVDFNHPLSSKDVTYEVTIHRVVTDIAERVKAFFSRELGALPEVTMQESNATVKFPQTLPAEITDRIAETLKGMIPELGTVTFS